MIFRELLELLTGKYPGRKRLQRGLGGDGPRAGLQTCDSHVRSRHILPSSRIGKNCAAAAAKEKNQDRGKTEKHRPLADVEAGSTGWGLKMTSVSSLNTGLSEGTGNALAQ